MISKRAAALGAVVIILITGLFSSFITWKASEYHMIDQGNKITAEEFVELKDFYKKFSQIRKLVEDEYIEEPDTDVLLTGAIKGMVEALDDPYSYYLTAKEYNEMMVSIQGSYAGVGISVTITKEDNAITVVRTFEDSPAFAAGIVTGDKIIRVDGQDVDGSRYEDAVNMMRGEPGTKVNVSIYRDGEVKEYTLTRAQINYPDLEYRMLDNNIGYLWLYRFDQNSSRNFLKALEEMMNQGMEGLVLDLRSNPGGLLTECLAISDMLLPEGLILYSEDRHGNREEYVSNEEHLGIPMAVLVNQYSASASEVLSGAIQDHGVGVIIGKTTFGKGLVQTLRGPFKEGDVLKLTTSKYFTPKGRDINKKGVVPDIEADYSEEAIEFMKNNLEPLPIELDGPLLAGIEEVLKILEK